MIAITESLKSVYLFSDMDAGDLHWIANQSSKKPCIAGEEVILEGTESDSLFILMEGSVKVQKTSAEGFDQEVTMLGAGTVFGEMAFVEQTPYSATVTVTEPALIVVIPFQALQQHVLAKPAFGVKLYHNICVYLSRRIRRTTITLAELRDLRLKHF